MNNISPQSDPVVESSGPLRKRTYAPTESSETPSTGSGKKRRVVVPGLGQPSTLNKSWWKFGSMQNDIIKNYDKNGSVGISANEEGFRPKQLPELARALLPTAAPTVPPNFHSQHAETEARRTMTQNPPFYPHSSQLSQLSQLQQPFGVQGLGFPSFGANPLHSTLGVPGFAPSIPNNSFLPLNANSIPIGNKRSSDTGGGLTSDEDDDDDGSITGLKFRAYQAENWTEKFEELIEYRNQFGNCLVPNAFTDNRALAQWVKRQRYQYKLKMEGKRSTMSDERIEALEDVGFIWDSHSAIWEERLNQLKLYKHEKGDCNVPSRYTGNRQLAVWVKRQRRQYKFYRKGETSSMTRERINKLEAIGFEWDLRSKDGAF